MLEVKLFNIVSVMADNKKITELFLVIGFQINIKGKDDLIVLQDKDFKTFFVEPKKVINRNDKTIDDMYVPGLTP